MVFGNYTTCNMMTGTGFDTSFLGSFSMAWLGIVILFFLVILARKWIGEEMGVAFNLIGGLVGAFLPYLLIVFFTCSYKIGIVGGIIGALVGAFLLGNIIGEDFSF
jgi:uncharacterized membrane protein YeaQ/YmgE (transglycosylase-associated protein family)